MIKKVLISIAGIVMSSNLIASQVVVPVDSHGCELAPYTTCFIRLTTPLTSSQNVANCLGNTYIRWDVADAGSESMLNMLSKLQSSGESITLGLSDTECLGTAGKAVWWRNDN